MTENHTSIVDNFWFRWIAANTFGWPVGLWGGYILAVTVDEFNLLGLIFGGILTGLVVGFFQLWAIQRDVVVTMSRWLTLSCIGGALGIVPAYLIAQMTGFNNWVLVALLIGAFFAACLGFMQGTALRGYYASTGRWLAFIMFGGAICGVLSMPYTPIYSAATLIVGPVLYGVITLGAFGSVRKSKPSPPPIQPPQP
jgi:hypothetical protein